MAVHKTPNDQRMVADRFRRIWAIVQRIADEPGMTRSDLASLFNLSERQVQADLNIIRVDMRLPLARRNGYRFMAADGSSVGAGGLDFADLLQLVTVVSVARGNAIDVGDGLAAKLAGLAPLHLRPLAHELFLGQYRESLRQLAVAALSTGERSVNVHVRRRTGQIDTAKPELIVPYRGVWFMVGQDQQTGRARMWRLADVTNVEPVSVRVERKNQGAA